MDIRIFLRKGLNLILVLVFVTAIGFFVATYFFDIKFFYPYIVQSGSMEPQIQTGSLVFSYPKKTYNPGDIITFSNGSAENVVTHRVEFKLYPDGIANEPVYLTSGDANEDFDRWEVMHEDIVGKVVFTAPYLGYAADFAKKPQGFILLVIIPATIIIYEELKILGREIIAFLKRIREEIRIKVFIPKKDKSPDVFPKKEPARTYIDIDERTVNLSPKTGLKRSSVLLPIIGSAFVLVSLSASFFSDTELSSGNIFQASDNFGVNPGEVVINEINWVGSNGDGLDEWVELLNTTSSAIDISGWVVENLGTGSGPNKDVVIPASSSIPANEFFLISNHDRAGSRIDVDPDFVTTNVSLHNGGEQLILKTDLDITIDTANGTRAWFEGDNSTPKKTMERKSSPGDGTQASNWQTATTHTNMDGSGTTDEFGTPKAPNGP